MLKKLRRFLVRHIPPFTFLNITQFLGALNDNIYRFLITYYLIQMEGDAKSSLILATTGAIFVLPFLLFSAITGGLADRFSKSKIITLAKIMEVFTVTLGLICFYLKIEAGAYLILFLMATQSSLFSPSKYGIIPEIVANEKIPVANGLMSAFTYLAIIIGSFLATFLTQMTNYNFVLSAVICLFIAVVGLITSLFIKRTRPANHKKVISYGIVLEIYQTLAFIKKEVPSPHILLAAISGSAFFLFVGAFMQLNLIPYAVQILGLSDVEGGYLFLYSAVGIGVGSYLSGIISGKTVELGMSPIAGVFLGVGCILLDVFSAHPHVVVVLSTLNGLACGLFLVPLDTTIQVLSPAHIRGQVVASTNFLSYIGVLLASVAIFLIHFMGFKPDTGFAIVGLITLVFVLFLSYLLFDKIVNFTKKVMCKLDF